MKNKASEKAPHITRGDVLDDLGFSPSEALEIKVKADLYLDLLAHIRDRNLTQQELATLLDIHQPDVSNLLTGKVSKFSVGKLIQFAGRMDMDAQIKLIKPRETTTVSLSAAGKPRKRERSAV